MTRYTFLVLGALVFGLVSSVGFAGDSKPGWLFVRGDINADGYVSLADLYTLVGIYEGPFTNCIDAEDIDDDGHPRTVADMIRLFQTLYTEDFSIPEPFPMPGFDLTSDDDWSCDFYDPVPPEVRGDIVRIGDVIARPGEEVAVPVYLTPAEPAIAVQLLAHYDPTVFTPYSLNGQDADLTERFFVGTVYEDYAQSPSLVGQHVDEAAGAFRFGYVPAIFFSGPILQPGVEVRVATILGTVREDATIGTESPLTVSTELDADRLTTEVVEDWDFVSVSLGARWVENTAPGTITVSQGAFERGDTNIDGVIDIADSIHLLNYLFAGTATLLCKDAGDINDDSQLDVSDSIALLSYSFSGGAAPPPPAGSCGTDPTLDDLDCVEFPRC